MAATTGKKSKRLKGKTLGIKDFLGNVPAAKIYQDDDEEFEGGGGGYSSRQRVPVVLPSASRASREGTYDDENVPQRGPFIAYISNLPYEVENSNIEELFANLKVSNLRLPREADGRLKGFGYVEFDDRESLVAAINIPDLTLSGRRMRIEVAASDDKSKFRRDRDRDREYDPERTSGDWRAGPRVEPEGGRGGGGSGGEGREGRDGPRDWGRDSFRRDEPGGDSGGSWRDAPRSEEPASGGAERSFGGRDSFGGDRGGGGGGYREGSRGFSRDGDRGFGRDGERGGFGGGDRGFSRDGDRGFGRDSDRSFSRDGDRGFSRDGDRGFSRDSDRGGGFGRDSERGYGRDGERSFGGGFGGDRGGYRRDEERGGGFGRSYDRYGDRGDRGGDREDRDAEVAGAEPRTRPKLDLLPRTVPLAPASEESKDDESSERKPISKPPVPAASIFGGAKPVDTTAREREIEERLMKKAEEMRLRDGRSKDRDDKWRKGEDIESKGVSIRRSDDRGSRLPYRSGDSRDTREYRENRDSGDNRDRDYASSGSSRDRRDGRKISRDSSKDNRDSRDGRAISGSRDNKDTKDRDTKEGGRKERNHEERPMPKAKNHEPPNFIALNKFSYLQTADDDNNEAASD